MNTTKKLLELVEEALIELREESLMKAAHYWKDKDPARYKKELSKLRRERTTPGHEQRAQNLAAQAKRRERAGPGTKSKKRTKNTGDTKSLKNGIKRAESKTGQKLSADRKNVKEGYGSSNTRYIPQKLNRGRHNADTKKIADWKKKLKKHNISFYEFATLLQAHVIEKYGESLAKTIDFDTIKHQLN